jgi:membrane-associated phospholipid phosphatase
VHGHAHWVAWQGLLFFPNNPLRELRIRADTEHMRRMLGTIMPLEWILLLSGALIALLYSFFGVPMPGASGASASQGPLIFYLKQILTALDVYCLIVLGFVAWQALHYLKRNSFRVRELKWGGFWKHILTRFYIEQIVQDLRFINAILVMFVEFALLKNLIPLVNPRVYDDWFIAVDRLVCTGLSCSELLQSLLGKSSTTLEYVSGHYFGYYTYMSLVVFLFVVCASRALAHQFLCAFVTLFLFGTLVIYLAPTWGPVYYHPEPFEFMKGSAMFGLQQNLWEMKSVLEQDRSNTGAVFMISGFPSLHVAVVTLGSIYLTRIHWGLALISWGFCVLTINSTIYLGWHYLLDDIGAFALVWSALLVGRWSSRRWSRLTDYQIYTE